MKRSICWALVLLAVAVQPAFGWPIAFPSGTTMYDPETAYNGYTLFTAMGTATASRSVYLINMSGEVVHEWKFRWGFLNARLLPNGNLVLVGFDETTPPKGRPGKPPFSMGGAAGILQEVTWDGEVVFSYTDLNMHHDAVKLDNGNYLYLAWEKVPPELQAKVHGGLENTEFRDVVGTKKKPTPEEMELLDKVMFNDVLVEVNPQGKVVWGWSANKHLDPDIDIIGIHYAREEWCHSNSMNLLKDGNILLTSRSLDSVLVVDKNTKKVIHRWGSKTRFNKETGKVEWMRSLTDQNDSDRTLSGPHAAIEVPPGVPGAGHIVCYDNGIAGSGPVRASRAVELVPATGDVVWSSTTMVKGLPVPFGRKHFSEFLGSVQKLPNGNMLICEGVNGQFFQLTQDHRQVWEYINPFSSDERFNGATQRAHCYPPGYCPQFRGLPPAEGKPVVLADSIAVSQPKTLLFQSPAVAIVAVGVGGLLVFVLAWTLGSWRTRAVLRGAASQKSKPRQPSSNTTS